MNTIGGLQTCNLICSSVRMRICTLDLSNASSKLCISFLSIHVILNRRAIYCISLESLCKAMCADRLLGCYSCNWTFKGLYSYCYGWLCTPSV